MRKTYWMPLTILLTLLAPLHSFGNECGILLSQEFNSLPLIVQTEFFANAHSPRVLLQWINFYKALPAEQAQGLQTSLEYLRSGDIDFAEGELESKIHSLIETRLNTNAEPSVLAAEYEKGQAVRKNWNQNYPFQIAVLVPHENPYAQEVSTYFTSLFASISNIAFRYQRLINKGTLIANGKPDSKIPLEQLQPEYGDALNALVAARTILESMTEYTSSTLPHLTELETAVSRAERGHFLELEEFFVPSEETEIFKLRFHAEETGIHQATFQNEDRSGLILRFRKPEQKALIERLSEHQMRAELDQPASVADLRAFLKMVHDPLESASGPLLDDLKTSINKLVESHEFAGAGPTFDEFNLAQWNGNAARVLSNIEIYLELYHPH